MGSGDEGNDEGEKSDGMADSDVENESTPKAQLPPKVRLSKLFTLLFPKFIILPVAVETKTPASPRTEDPICTKSRLLVRPIVYSLY